jgi:hypothetical protein
MCSDAMVSRQLSKLEDKDRLVFKNQNRQWPGKLFSKPVSHHVESATGLIDIPQSLRYVSDYPKIAFKVTILSPHW